MNLNSCFPNVNTDSCETQSSCCENCEEGIWCPTMLEFHRFLTGLVGQYHGSKADLAKALKITPSRLSRYFQPNNIPRLEILLRLADATGTMPSKVLRAAGRGAASDLIEEMYGPAAERRQAFMVRYGLTIEEGQVLELWRALKPKDRHALVVIMKGLIEATAPPVATRRRVRRADDNHELEGRTGT